MSDATSTTAWRTAPTVFHAKGLPKHLDGLLFEVIDDDAIIIHSTETTFGEQLLLLREDGVWEVSERGGHYEILMRPDDIETIIRYVTTHGPPGLPNE